MVFDDEGWIETSEVHPMFPTFAWQIQLAPAVFEPLDAQILDLIADLRVREPELGPSKAWQSPQHLHERAELANLVGCVDRAVRTVLRFLRVGYDAFEITACWANVNAPGAAHRRHNHPNNYLSGVYYVRAHPGADTISFHDPRVQTSLIRPPVSELTAENTDQVVVRVREGTLLLFPSFLEHSVSANRSPEARVSVSFNVMFSAFTEKLAKPLW